MKNTFWLELALFTFNSRPCAVDLHNTTYHPGWMFNFEKTKRSPPLQISAFNAVILLPECTLPYTWLSDKTRCFFYYGLFKLSMIHNYKTIRVQVFGKYEYTVAQMCDCSSNRKCEYCNMNLPQARHVNFWYEFGCVYVYIYIYICIYIYDKK